MTQVFAALNNSYEVGFPTQNSAYQTGFPIAVYPSEASSTRSIDELYEKITRTTSYESCAKAIHPLLIKLTSPSCRCASSRYCNEFYDTCKKLIAFFAKKTWCNSESSSDKRFNDFVEIKMAKQMLGIATTEQYTKRNVGKVCRNILAANHPDKTRQSAGEIWFTTSDACSLLKEDLRQQKEEGAIAWVKKKIFE